MLRYPSLRAPLDLLFLVCCIALTADVLVPEIWGSGKTKDYPLWFWAGQQVLQGKDLYPSDPTAYFEFIYPPLSAVLLAIPSFFGKIPLYLCLSLLNVVAWWMTAQFSHAMTGSGRKPGPVAGSAAGLRHRHLRVRHVRPRPAEPRAAGADAVRLLAAAATGARWMAGSMFALATAIKVFPVAVLPYLVWRRQWAAAASMLVFLGVFLFVLPAPFRGFQHNVSELKTWYQGMVGSSSEKGFGQRDEQNWSWVNQSIIAMTHRLTRPINYNQDDPAKPVAHHECRQSRFQDGELDRAGDLACDRARLSRGDAAAHRAGRERSDAEEIGILFCLMTVASPLARQYYFMWLFFPITVLIHRAAYDPRPAVRPAHGRCWPSRAACCACRCRCFRTICRPMATISPPPSCWWRGWSGTSCIRRRRTRRLASGRGRATT